jgi:hypothetical protein
MRLTDSANVIRVATVLKYESLLGEEYRAENRCLRANRSASEDACWKAASDVTGSAGLMAAAVRSHLQCGLREI